ncbi:MAG: NAD(P)-dependent oxidoreductase [Candidatus Doudnabacteria bacterium]|nr:NAD(P)-dependent oxidoreductase [Candidatus Doudnabacteria bacterium]
MQASKKKILVGGGAGYIGTMLVPKLLELGHEVTVIDTCWFGNYLDSHVNLVKKDLFECMESDFSGFDQVIFLAGLSNDPMAEHSPSKNFMLNAALPCYMAYLAKRAGVKRFICASSCSVYGFTHNQAYDELAAANCEYPYGISKLEGETGVMQMQGENFSVISLRQGTVSGYSPRMRMDLVVNAMFKSALLDNKIIINNPDIWRPIYDLRDVVKGFVSAVEAPEQISGIFNVASKNYQVKEIAEAVKKVLESCGEPEILLETKFFQDSRNYKISTAKAEEVLGFKPQFLVEDTVKDLYDHKDKMGDLEQDAYYNIRIFKNLVKKEELKKATLEKMEEFKY